jgi:hypothetical protein
MAVAFNPESLINGRRIFRSWRSRISKRARYAVSIIVMIHGKERSLASFRCRARARMISLMSQDVSECRPPECFRGIRDARVSLRFRRRSASGRVRTRALVRASPSRGSEFSGNRGFPFSKRGDRCGTPSRLARPRSAQPRRRSVRHTTDSPGRMAVYYGT